MKTAAAVIAAVLMLASAAEADAGTYVFRNCSASGALHFDGSLERYGRNLFHRTQTCSSHGGGRVGIYQDRSGPALRAGEGAAYRWKAPSTTHFTASRVSGELRNANGIAAQVYVTNRHGGYIDVDDGHAHDGDEETMSTGFAIRPRSEFAIRVACFNRPPCSNNRRVVKAYAQIDEIQLTVKDDTDPVIFVNGELSDANGPVTGRIGYSFAASDRGGGLHKLYAEVNESVIDLGATSCPGDQGWFTDREAPCQSYVKDSGHLDTDDPPFREGENRIRFCAEDFASGSGDGASPNVTCTARSLTVDNERPGRPSGLTAVGGSGWRTSDAFEVAWDRPVGETTPIVRAHYQLIDASGRTVSSGYKDLSGGKRSLAVRLPFPGAYSLQVRLEDGAGNRGLPRQVALRYDDSRPGPPSLAPKRGWLSKDDFPLTLRVAEPDDIGPSGLIGYAVRLGTESQSQPCAKRTCKASEVTLEKNAEEGDSVVRIPLLAEGEHWLSVASVSGALLSSAEIASTRLRVDLTDPRTVLEGVPAGWVRGPVTVEAGSTDPLSGMDPKHAGPDATPTTAIQIEGQQPVYRPGDRAELRLEADGEHQVVAWARDAAGNEASGRKLANGLEHDEPAKAVVRIDGSAPDVQLIGQDPIEPEVIHARATDALSGIRSTRIQYRPSGGSDYVNLPTHREGTRLAARFPSESVPKGEYEFRVRAADEVGNVAVSKLDAGHSELQITNPVKPVPELGVTWAGRRADRMVWSPKRRPVLAGIAKDENGNPLADVDIRLIETFDPGSLRPRRVRTLSSDTHGRYAARIGAGPSRRIHVEFDGNPELTSATSNVLRLAARARLAMGLSPQVALNGQQIRMGGYIHAPGAAAPASGKTVAIQYFDPAQREWRPVAFTRANRKGRFRFGYRFTTIASPQRIVFRATTLPEAGWPYRPAASRPRSVVVYPRYR